MKDEALDRVVEMLDTPALTTLIIKWHQDRNLIDGSTDKDQTLKLAQEMGELSDSICKGESPIDDLGDMMVVMLNIMKRNNLTMEECLRHSYKEIMHRTGRMVDGVFVKEEDLDGDDGWIEVPSHGKRPVPLDTQVDIRMRGGVQLFGRTSRFLRWGVSGLMSDIVAYRVCK